MQLEIDALFVLKCGCILDGCSGSHQGQQWRAGNRQGMLWCEKHSWQLLVDVVFL